MSTSVKLKLVPSKLKSKEGVVCLQLIHNRKVKLSRTRFRLFPCEWDDRKETAVRGNAGTERENQLQSIADGLEAELRQIGELIRFLEQKGEYTVEELTDLYVHRSFNGYLFPFIDHLAGLLNEENRLKSASILLTVKRSFERFRNAQDVLISKMDNDLMLRYESYLKATGVTKNTVACYMRALRSTYNQAVKRRLSVQNHPFANIFTRNDKTVKRAVTEEVIRLLKNSEWPGRPELALTRDLFMFSFYMRGISFVDMANLRKANVRNGYIVYTRSKTRQTLTVKIEACMQEIISRYEAQTAGDYLLPVLTAQNRHPAGALRSYNKRLKRISTLLGFDPPLSSYVARHSWATLALRKGIPIKVISEGMGHESEATTRIYLASLGQSVVDKANAEIIALG